MLSFDQIADRVAAHGLGVTGWLHPTADDGAPDGTKTILLLGYDGPAMWQAFKTSPEWRDGVRHGLDRWSTRIIGALAAELDGTALFPFGGPPYQPFIRWTYAGEPIHQSVLGMSIHPDRGLWSGWRGAIALTHRLELPPVVKGAHPCHPCPADAPMPCRAACPVGAFSDGGYDVDACRAHLNTDAGAPCRSGGCLARRACPVGADFAQSAEQAAFHLDAFRIA